MNQNLQTATNKGIEFLAKDQEKDGSFMCLVSTKLDEYGRANTNTVPAIVPPNIVLSSLINISGKASDKIKKKTVAFLLGERGEYWSFNYWFKKSEWFKKEPYPDDLDDTFCALAALYEYKPELFDGEVMAKIATMLTSAEKQEGGPYDMWLVPPEGRKTWNDTDLVVNSNVAFFLSLQDIYLPKLTGFIEMSIDKKRYEFPYNKIYPGIYFISRFYKGKKMAQMERLLLSKQEADGKWENPLRTALAISALINFSRDKHRKQLEKGIQYLLKTQGKNGSWKPYSFYFQMRTPKKTLYAGSASITTALCLEAINNFKLAEKPNLKKIKIVKADEIYSETVKIVKARFSKCGGDLKMEAYKVIAGTVKGDKDRQIALLPYFFAHTLGQLGKQVPDELLVKLGAANMFGWMAYTIYDDFLDGEGDPKLLSVANLALRESAGILNDVMPIESGFPEFSRITFDVIDSANAWEIANCRSNHMPDYGDYSQLAGKSLGHSLGPIAVLFSLGYGENSPEVKNMMSFFRHYLIARQLDDDAHDWEDDLKKGHINAAAVRMFPKDKHRAGADLHKTFWERTIVPVCKDILAHIGLARKALQKLSIIEEPAMFEKILISIEGSAQKALKEREETLKFIKTYKNPN